MEIELEAAKTAEMSVIGAIIIESKSLAQVIDELKPEHFYFEQLKICYEAILRLSSKGNPIDFVTVLSEITSSDNMLEKDVKSLFDFVTVLSEITSSDNMLEKDVKSLLLACTECTRSVSNTPQYSKIIINSYKARKLKEIGAKIVFETTLDCAEEVTIEAMTGFYEIMKSQKNTKITIRWRSRVKTF